MATLVELQQSLEAKNVQLSVLTEKADPTPDDLKTAETLDTEMTSISNEIKAYEAARTRLGGLKSKVQATHSFLNDPAPGGGMGGVPFNGNIEQVMPEAKGLCVKVFGNGGYANDPKKALRYAAGQFFWDIKGYLHPHSPNRESYERIMAWTKQARLAGLDRDDQEIKAPSGMFESSDPDGGILVPPDVSQSILERDIDEEDFLAESDSLTIRGNMMTLPALDDASRADGSREGGVASYWAGEADQYATASRPKFRGMDLRLHKLYVFVYLTEELVKDSPFALENYVSGKAAREIRFKTNDKMVRGTGAGMPQGVLNSKSKIAVTKETGQAAASILVDNIEKMWMRMNSKARKNASWLINQDTEAQLNLMSFPVGTGGVPIFQPQGALNSPNFPTLKGRPVRTVEFCETLGTEGDIILTNWKYYQAIRKGDVESDMSMHVRFQYGELAYRFTFRVDGQSKWDLPLTPYKGSNTTSAIVTLATRS